MKNLPLFFAALLCASAVQAAPQPDLIARIHFAGAEKISADMNSNAFTNEFCSAEAMALKTQTLDKLANFFAIQFKSTNGAAQLRPLLDDLLKSEWIFEMRAAPSSPEYALAIRLSNERWQFWSKSLTTVLGSSTYVGVDRSLPGVLSWQEQDSPNGIQFIRSGDWAILDCGQEWLLWNRILAHSDEDNWLSANLNWSRLAQFFPPLKAFDFPETHLQATGRDGNLRLDGKFILSQPLSPSEKWRVPVSAIHQPLTSFTAARGFAPWLAGQNLPYEISPVPDQVFIWSLAQVPVQTFAAVPVPDAKGSLAQLEQKLSLNTGWENHFMPPLTLAATNNQIFWTGVPPFIAPNVRALHEASGDFLLAGFFENSPGRRPLPPELSAQLAAPNIVYYHWEITGERLKELPQLTQLGLMLTHHRQLGGDSAAAKWLDRFGSALGNSVTTVTQTAIEFVALANWLEAANFPGCDLSLQLHPHLRNRKLPASTPSMPLPR
jgi:hypothetical protein